MSTVMKAVVAVLAAVTLTLAVGGEAKARPVRIVPGIVPVVGPGVVVGGGVYTESVIVRKRVVRPAYYSVTTPYYYDTTPYYYDTTPYYRGRRVLRVR